MYIVIDTFDYSFPQIITDENGYPLIFDDINKAQEEANECQKAIVVEI